MFSLLNQDDVPKCPLVNGFVRTSMMTVLRIFNRRSLFESWARRQLQTVPSCSIVLLQQIFFYAFIITNALCSLFEGRFLGNNQKHHTMSRFSLRRPVLPRLSVMARSWKIFHDHGFFDALLLLSWKTMDGPWQGMAPWIIIHDFDP